MFVYSALGLPFLNKLSFEFEFENSDGISRPPDRPDLDYLYTAPQSPRRRAVLLRTFVHCQRCKCWNRYVVSLLLNVISVGSDQQVAGSTLSIHWQQTDRCPGYVAPAVHQKTSMTSADNLDLKQLAHGGRPGSEELHCEDISTPIPPFWTSSFIEPVVNEGVQEPVWCGGDAEPQTSGALPHSGLTVETLEVNFSTTSQKRIAVVQPACNKRLTQSASRFSGQRSSIIEFSWRSWIKPDRQMDVHGIYASSHSQNLFYAESSSRFLQGVSVAASPVLATIGMSVCPSVCPSVRLSVCPSHAGTEWKRRKLGSRNLHRRIAQGL